MNGANRRGPTGRDLNESPPSEGTRNTRTWKACCDARSREGGSIEIDSYFSESLILAQNERWQRGLGMQVERDHEDSNILG